MLQVHRVLERPWSESVVLSQITKKAAEHGAAAERETHNDFEKLLSPLFQVQQTGLGLFEVVDARLERVHFGDSALDLAYGGLELVHGTHQRLAAG